MGQFSALKTDGQLNKALAKLFGDLLEKEVVQAILVPATQSQKNVVMQTLFTDPKRLDTVDPFAPVVPSSSAKIVSSLVCKPSGRPIAVVLRSCELRAFMELVKLRQGYYEDLLLIGIDCLGRYENTDYLKLAETTGTLDFLKNASKNNGAQTVPGFDITNACKACEYPICNHVDLRLCVIGAEPGKEIWIEAESEKGQEAMATLGLPAMPTTPAGRDEAIEALKKERTAFKEKLFAGFKEKTKDVEGLSNVIAGCVNCYNCRVACPVCYCRECVFVTDTFRHDGEQYMTWSRTRGRLKMPTDTLFYHLTRMVHMSTLCVGCGQCSSACPNDIPVMELFRSIADDTQKRFDYMPGSNPDDPQPLAAFYENEFDDVTGQTK
ncbi:MAG: 4Fe-4S binding protein [Pseudomonadota bacterium]